VDGAAPVPGRGRAAGPGGLAPPIASAPRAARYGAHDAGGARDWSRLAPALSKSAERALLFIAGVTGQGKITDPITATSCSAKNVLYLQGDIFGPAKGLLVGI